VSEATRDQIDCKVTLTADFAERMSRDSNLKIMIYCAGEPVSPFSRVEITFPTQIEIKINGDDVKANFKGLKNKPGSTRPVDITNLIRKKPSYENIMSVTYALTNKVYQSSNVC
jgi:E3 SUMO-protein ligase PIAS1